MWSEGDHYFEVAQSSEWFLDLFIRLSKKWCTLQKEPCRLLKRKLMFKSTSAFPPLPSTEGVLHPNPSSCKTTRYFVNDTMTCILRLFRDWHAALSNGQCQSVQRQVAATTTWLYTRSTRIVIFPFLCACFERAMKCVKMSSNAAIVPKLNYFKLQDYTKSNFVFQTSPELNKARICNSPKNISNKQISLVLILVPSR